MAESAELNITLETFNPNSEEAPVVNSPRSLEVCRQQGIKPQDLVKLSKDKMKQKFDKEQFQTEGFFDRYYTHFEDKRIQKVSLLIKLRKEMIDSERKEMAEMSRSVPNLKPNMNGSLDSPSIKSGGGLSMVEKERKLLEKLQQSQVREIQKMIEFEEKMEELRRQNELKEQKQQERQKKFEQELEAKRRMGNEKRLKQEQDKRQRELLEEEEAKRKKHEMFLQEQENLRREQQREAERRKLALLKEEETKKKMEELQKMNEAAIREQEKAAQEREKKREEKEQYRKQKFDAQNEERRRLVEEARLHHEERIKLAKDKNDEALIKQRQEFEKQQFENEERRKKFEIDQQIKLERLRQESQKKEEELKRAWNMNAALEEKKREDYFARQRIENARHAELAKIREREEQEKRIREMEKEQRLKDVLKKNDTMLEHRKGELLSKINSKDAKVLNAQRVLKQQMDLKKSVDYLKTTDRLENVERIREIQEYEKQKLLKRIEDDNQRAVRLRKEQDDLIAMRQKIRREMDSQKERMLKEFMARQKRQQSSGQIGQAGHFDGVEDPTMTAQSNAYSVRT